MTAQHNRAFNGGILGPGMYDRTDISKYQSGVSDAENTVVLPQGGMENRAGFLLAGGFDNTTVDGHVWLVPFEFSTEDTYILEFADEVLRIMKNGAYVLDSAVTPQSVTSISDADPAEITMVDATAASQFTVGRLVFFEGPNGDHALRRSVLRVTGIAAAVISFEIVDTTTADTSAGDWGSVGAGATLSEVYEIASPYAIEDLPELDMTQDVNELYLAHDAYDQRVLTRVADDDWTFAVVTPAPSIDAPTSVSAAASSGSGSTTYVYTVSAIDEASGEESLPGNNYGVNNDLTSAGATNTVTWSAVAGASRYRVYKKSNGLFGFIGDTLDLSFIDDNIVADTEITPQQSRDPFPTALDRPKRVGFVEQRLTFAATTNNPQLVEMSNSQAPRNFNRALNPADSDAVTFRMRAQKLNRITAIVPSDPHIIFTVGGEWTLEGGDQKGYITPSNPIVRPHTYFGSADYPKPLVVGEAVLHVLNNRRHIREMRPKRETPSAEVTLLARHLFKRRTITSWCYAQHPDSVVWVTLDDGALLTLTYLVEHEVWGWTKQKVGGTNVKVRQVTSVREGAQDTVYIVVERLLSGRTTTLVERLAPRDFETVADCYFVDSGAIYSGAATTTLNGLLHLRGEPAAILADGNVIEDVVVDERGSIDLQFSASKISAGLGYEAFLTTLGVDFGAVQGLGDTRGRYKAASEVAVGVDETRGIAVGTGGGVLNEVREFTGASPIPLFTGLYTVPIDGDWERDARVQVRQRYPLPMTVTGITPDWELEDG